MDMRHTEVVKKIKQKIKSLPSLGIPYLAAFMIVEIDVSDIVYGGILKQWMQIKNN